MKISYNFKAQCPNQHWEYGTALCEKEYSDFEYHMDYNKTSRSYCCERKISEECRPRSDPYTAENCTKTCQEDIAKTREECRSENDKHQYKRYKKEWENGGEWEEGKKGAVLCVLRHLVPECKLPIKNLHILLIEFEILFQPIVTLIFIHI